MLELFYILALVVADLQVAYIFRHALEDSLERAFRPAVAAVIAFIDPHKNMRLVQTNPACNDLWISIFDICDKLGLSYEKLIKAAPGKAPSSVSAYNNTLLNIIQICIHIQYICRCAWFGPVSVLCLLPKTSKSMQPNFFYIFLNLNASFTTSRVMIYVDENFELHLRCRMCNLNERVSTGVL